MSQDEATLNSEQIKSVAITIIKLRLSKDVSYSVTRSVGQSVGRSVSQSVVGQ